MTVRLLEETIPSNQPIQSLCWNLRVNGVNWLLVIVDISIKPLGIIQFVTDLQRCVGSRITD